MQLEPGLQHMQLIISLDGYERYACAGSGACGSAHLLQRPAHQSYHSTKESGQGIPGRKNESIGHLINNLCGQMQTKWR